MLCCEPFYFHPWEVGRLTPFQVKEILLSEKDKNGLPVLDPPAEVERPEELTLERELRRQFLRMGVTDPDAVAMLVEEKIQRDSAGGWAAMFAFAADGPEDDPAVVGRGVGREGDVVPED